MNKRRRWKAKRKRYGQMVDVMLRAHAVANRKRLGLPPLAAIRVERGQRQRRLDVLFGIGTRWPPVQRWVQR